MAVMSTNRGKPFPCLCSLSHALKHESHYLADVVLYLKEENTTFPCHGLVLEARSPRFRQLLLSARSNHVHSAECFLTRCKYILEIAHPLTIDSSSFSAFMELLYDGKVSSVENAKRSSVFSLCDFYQVGIDLSVGDGPDITSVVTKQASYPKGAVVQNNPRKSQKGSSPKRSPARKGSSRGTPGSPDSRLTLEAEMSCKFPDDAYLMKVKRVQRSTVFNESSESCDETRSQHSASSYDDAERKSSLNTDSNVLIRSSVAANAVSSISVDDDARSLRAISQIDSGLKTKAESPPTTKGRIVIPECSSLTKTGPPAGNRGESSLIDAFRGPSRSVSADVIAGESPVSSLSATSTSTEDDAARASTMVLRVVQPPPNGSGDSLLNVTEYAIRDVAKILDDELGTNSGLSPRRVYRGEDDNSNATILVRLPMKEANRILAGDVHLKRGSTKLVFEPHESEKVWALSFEWTMESGAEGDPEIEYAKDAALVFQSQDGVVSVEVNERPGDEETRSSSSSGGGVVSDQIDVALSKTGKAFFYSKSGLYSFLQKGIQRRRFLFKVAANYRNGLHIRKFRLFKDRTLPYNVLLHKITDVLKERYPGSIFSVFLHSRTQDLGEIAFSEKEIAVDFESNEKIELEIGGVQMSMRHRGHIAQQGRRLMVVELTNLPNGRPLPFQRMRDALSVLGRQCGMFRVFGNRATAGFSKIEFKRYHLILTNGFVDIEDGNGSFRLSVRLVP